MSLVKLRIELDGVINKFASPAKPFRLIVVVVDVSILVLEPGQAYVSRCVVLVLAYKTHEDLTRLPKRRAHTLCLIQQRLRFGVLSSVQIRRGLRSRGPRGSKTDLNRR